MRERERAIERESRQEARRFLLDARSEVERTIRELKGRAVEQAGLDDAARAARQHVEQLAEAERAALRSLDDATGAGPPSTAIPGDPLPGDLVHVAPLGGRQGRVVEVRDDSYVVAVGDVKMSFGRPDLTRAAAPDSGRVTTTGSWHDLPDAHAVTEIDVRGMRAAELDEVVLQALDAAIRADLPSLRIIHGKGTGALRERVAELLRKDTRVRSFRLGAWNEGGAGVTVADL